MKRVNVANQIADCFNLDELRQLCFDLSINFENIAGITLKEKAAALVIYCDKGGLLGTLLQTCRSLRPKYSWPERREFDIPSDPKSIEAADALIEQRRLAVIEWGKTMSDRGWCSHAWHSLGQALQLSCRAVETAPNYPRAWTLLADTYHRIGETELAEMSLKISRRLAQKEKDGPGKLYLSIEKNMQSGYPFNSVGKLHRQSAPAWFCEKYESFLKPSQLMQMKLEQ